MKNDNFSIELAKRTLYRDIFKKFKDSRIDGIVTKYLIANWKLYGHLSMIDAYIKTCRDFKICSSVITMICPPAIYLPYLQKKVQKTNFVLGAQNCASFDIGAFTGEISAKMLQEFGCKYVIIGHSERRRLFGENEDILALKLKQAFHAGLIPILCVGETKEERNNQQVKEVIANQVKTLQQLLYNKQVEQKECLVAYEPVWAIGSTEVASPKQAQEVHQYIRSLLGDKVPLLYGGSIKSTNAQAIFRQKDINGGLVGGASLNPREMNRIKETLERG